MAVRVFDILYLNGQSLINYTLRDRRKALERSIKSVHRRMEVHQYVEAQEGREIEKMLRQVIAEASEGLVIKVGLLERVEYRPRICSPNSV